MASRFHTGERRLASHPMPNFSLLFSVTLEYRDSLRHGNVRDVAIYLSLLFSALDHGELCPDLVVVLRKGRDTSLDRDELSAWLRHLSLSSDGWSLSPTLHIGLHSHCYIVRYSWRYIAKDLVSLSRFVGK